MHNAHTEGKKSKIETCYVPLYLYLYHRFKTPLHYSLSNKSFFVCCPIRMSPVIIIIAIALPYNNWRRCVPACAECNFRSIVWFMHYNNGFVFVE